MDHTLLIVSILVLAFLVCLMAEGFAAHLDRRAHPEREAKRPRYKPVWQFVGVLAWNIPLIAALLLGGEWAAIAVAPLLLACYGIFRYRLGRSPAMQRRFLKLPLLDRGPSDSHPATEIE